MNTAALPQNILRGVILIIATALLISIQDLIFKLFSGTLPLWQVFALRGLLTLPLLTLIAWPRGQLRSMLTESYSPWALLRTLFMTCAFVIFYAALPFVSLSTAGAGIYLAPIFVALLSAFVIGERVSPLGWIGVFLGFAGVVILLRPGSDAFTFFALLPIASAVFYALAIITTRSRCHGISAQALALSFNASLMIAGFVVSVGLTLWTPRADLVESYPFIFDTWSSVAGRDWLILLVLAALAGLIGVMLAMAYQVAPPPTIATFEYSYIVFVALWDIVFFGIAPTVFSVTGIVMIIGAGVLVMRRQKTEPSVG